MHLSISAVAHGEVGSIVDVLHFFGSEIDGEPNFRSLRLALVLHNVLHIRGHAVVDPPNNLAQFGLGRDVVQYVTVVCQASSLLVAPFPAS